MIRSRRTLLPVGPAASPVLLALAFSIALLANALAQKTRSATTLTPLPTGLTIPIEIHRAIKAGSTKPGTAVIGITTQRIPVGQDLYLNAGAQVIGTVVSSTAADPVLHRASTLAIQFNRLTYRHQTVPILAGALAIANFTDVADTFAPASGAADRGNPSPASWTTHQIGDDEVSRSGWIGEVVDAATRRVGFADYYGVYADPPPNATGDAAIPHALGVFSTNARGLYGFSEGAALSSSASNIVITSPGKLVLRNGDDLLLKVMPPP